MIGDFELARPPGIIFGAGKFSALPAILSSLGKSVIIVTGGKSFTDSDYWVSLTGALESRGVRWNHVRIEGEPSPSVIDDAASKFRSANINAVAAIGGGSVLDAGKAIAAMIVHDREVTDYLEGVGDPSLLTGKKVPFAAVPTTSGTGSEATKNAVLSRVGKNGFKKSLRHDNFVPDIALVDPELTLSCPREVTAACGMDAFSQLLESYVSTKASPMTDALAFGAMGYVRDCLLPSCGAGAGDIRVRTGMAYASLVSGITLANAGLGTVHGVAGVLGGLFDIPHGAACGTLLSSFMEATIHRLQRANRPDDPFLKKFASVGNLLCNEKEPDTEKACEMLINELSRRTAEMKMPGLGEFGITEDDLDNVVEQCGNKFNPAPLSKEEIKAILRKRL